jgi:hypothetical protein
MSTVQTTAFISLAVMGICALVLLVVTIIEGIIKARGGDDV